MSDKIDMSLDDIIKQNGNQFRLPRGRSGVRGARTSSERSGVRGAFGPTRTSQIYGRNRPLPYSRENIMEQQAFPFLRSYTPPVPAFSSISEGLGEPVAFCEATDQLGERQCDPDGMYYEPSGFSSPSAFGDGRESSSFHEETDEMGHQQLELSPHHILEDKRELARLDLAIAKMENLKARQKDYFSRFPVYPSKTEDNQRLTALGNLLNAAVVREEKPTTHREKDLPPNASTIFDHTRGFDELCEVTASTRGSGEVTAKSEQSEIQKNDLLPPATTSASRSQFPYDETINVCESKTESNRNLLASAIPYFEKMFRKRLKEDSKTEIMLEGSDPASTKCLTDHVHDSNLNTAEDQSLLKTSACLRLEGIAETCLQCLWKEINPENALIFRACADIARSEKWKMRADRYIGLNFENVCRTPEFLDLPYLALKELVCKDDLVLESEQTLLDSVIRWVKASEVCRRVSLPELLRHVRLPLLGDKYLSELKSSEELIRSSYLCRSIVMNATVHNMHHQSTLAEEVRTIAVRHKQSVKNMGYGMYWVCRKETDSLSVYYYDDTKYEWAVLCEEIHANHTNYIVCKPDIIYFTGSNYRSTLVLNKLLHATNIVMEDHTPTGAGIVLHQDKTYFFGNILFSDSAKVVLFDPMECLCAHVGNMLENRTDPGVVSLKGDIYVTGGHNSTTILNSAETYNPLTNLSTKISAMLHKRTGHGCATVGGKIYVCGGDTLRETQARFTSTAEVYSRKAKQWTSIARTNSLRFCMCLFSVNRKLYAIDADSDAEDDFQVEMYDPRTKVWQYEGFIPSSKGRDLTVFFTNSASKLRSR